MASKYSVTYNGMDGRVVNSFSKIEDVTEYVKARFDEDYQDGEAEFHNDYGTFTLRGITLAELGLGRFVPKPLTIQQAIDAGRFVVVLWYPIYDNRDAVRGRQSFKHGDYATREEAELATETIFAGDDVDIEILPERPYVKSVVVSADDLPF